MKIVVTANGNDLDALASPVFGRCPVYIFVDTETMDFQAVENPAISAPGGAGIQAAQFVIKHGAQAVLTGNLGPNAANVLQTASMSVYQISEGTVRQVVEMFKQNRLSSLSGATAPPHAGMAGRSMRGGQGRAITPPSVQTTSRQQEIADLRQTANDLRRQLAQVMERLEKLDKD